LYLGLIFRVFPSELLSVLHFSSKTALFNHVLSARRRESIVQNQPDRIHNVHLSYWLFSLASTN